MLGGVKNNLYIIWNYALNSLSTRHCIDIFDLMNSSETMSLILLEWNG